MHYYLRDFRYLDGMPKDAWEYYSPSLRKEWEDAKSTMG